MSVQYIASTSPRRNGNSHAVSEYDRLKRRDEQLFARLRVLLGRKTLGSDIRLWDRGDRIAEVMGEIHQVWGRIVEIERS